MAWMLAVGVGAVLLQVMLLVVWPLNVRVNVPPVMPLPKVSVCTAFTPAAGARVVELLTVTAEMPAVVVAIVRVLVPPVRAILGAVIVGRTCPPRAFWKTTVTLVALRAVTTALLGPMVERALRAAWMFARRVSMVLL